MTLNFLSSCLQLLNLYSAKDGTQSFAHAMEALCQMSYILCPTGEIMDLKTFSLLTLKHSLTIFVIKVNENKTAHN